MTEDEVVRAVRAAREAFAASHGYDVRAMVAAHRELGLASGREVVRLPPPRTEAQPNATADRGRIGVPGDSKLSGYGPGRRVRSVGGARENRSP